MSEAFPKERERAEGVATQEAVAGEVMASVAERSEAAVAQAAAKAGPVVMAQEVPGIPKVVVENHVGLSNIVSRASPSFQQYEC